MLISINGIILEGEVKEIAPTSEAFLYGYGVFETIKFKGGNLHFLKEHYERLKKGCEVLKIPLEYPFYQVEKFCYQLLQANKMQEGSLKILYGKNHGKNDLLLTVAESKYKNKSYIEGFKLCFTENKRNPYSFMTYIKSNNYLENLLARNQAIEKGYDEVVFENVHGKLCEGAFSNLFFVKKGIIYTPHQACGLLEGIMRSRVIQIAQELDYPLEIGQYIREDLLLADEIFLTNSLMEIMPVVQLENRRMDINNNRITKMLMETLRE